MLFWVLGPPSGFYLIVYTLCNFISCVGSLFFLVEVSRGRYGGLDFSCVSLKRRTSRSIQKHHKAFCKGLVSRAYFCCYKIVGKTAGMNFGTGGGSHPTSRRRCSTPFIEEEQKKSITHNSLLLPISTIPVLRWRTGGDGGGARPRTVKTTMNLVLVLVPRVEGLRPQQVKAEEKIPIGRKRQQRRRLPRAVSSRSVWVANSGC